MARVTPDQAVRRKLKSTPWFDYADPAVLPLVLRLDDRLLSRIRPLLPSGGVLDAGAVVAAQAKGIVPQLEQVIRRGSDFAVGEIVLRPAAGTMLGVAAVAVHFLLYDGRLYASDSRFFPDR
jgi:hypothetical protein